MTISFDLSEIDDLSRIAQELRRPVVPMTRATDRVRAAKGEAWNQKTYGSLAGGGGDYLGEHWKAPAGGWEGRIRTSGRTAVATFHARATASRSDRERARIGKAARKSIDRYRVRPDSIMMVDTDKMRGAFLAPSISSDGRRVVFSTGELEYAGAQNRMRPFGFFTDKEADIYQEEISIWLDGLGFR